MRLFLDFLLLYHEAKFSGFECRAKQKNLPQHHPGSYRRVVAHDTPGGSIIRSAEQHNAKRVRPGDQGTPRQGHHALLNQILQVGLVRFHHRIFLRSDLDQHFHPRRADAVEIFFQRRHIVT